MYPSMSDEYKYNKNLTRVFSCPTPIHVGPWYGWEPREGKPSLEQVTLSTELFDIHASIMGLFLMFVQDADDIPLVPSSISFVYL